MKYIEIKNIIASMFMKASEHGVPVDLAKAEVLESCTDMFHKQNIGYMDLKYAFQILRSEYSEELNKLMQDIKRGILLDYGINDIVRGEMRAGASRDDAVIDAIRIAYESFRAGKIGTPEQLDSILWALGYRLTEEFLLSSDERMKQGILYEEDR